jgi:SAM-dependent methyltransferase
VEERVSRPLPRLTAGRWAFWQHNWIVHRAIDAALSRARRHVRGVLLDVGSGPKALAHHFEGAMERYVGVDLPGSAYLAAGQPDVYGRAEALPVRDQAVDTVLVVNLLTYLPEPAVLLAEARRVLRPGGVLIAEFTAMAAPQDPVHDYLRFTRRGAEWLLDRSGFETLEVVPIGGAWTHLARALMDRIRAWNQGPLRVLTELPARALVAGIQLACRLLDRLFDDPAQALAHLVIARRAADPPAPRS